MAIWQNAGLSRMCSVRLVLRPTGSGIRWVRLSADGPDLVPSCLAEAEARFGSSPAPLLVGCVLLFASFFFLAELEWHSVQAGHFILLYVQAGLVI
jgi:hypothetical protein